MKADRDDDGASIDMIVRCLHQAIGHANPRHKVAYEENSILRYCRGCVMDKDNLSCPHYAPVAVYQIYEGGKD